MGGSQGRSLSGVTFRHLRFEEEKGGDRKCHGQKKELWHGKEFGNFENLKGDQFSLELSK